MKFLAVDIYITVYVTLRCENWQKETFRSHLCPFAHLSFGYDMKIVFFRHGAWNGRRIRFFAQINEFQFEEIYFFSFIFIFDIIFCSYKSMVCAGHERRGSARMCRIRFRRRRNANLCIWRHGWIRKIFKWTLRIASDQMGMAQTIAEGARKRATAVSTFGPQFHQSRQ